MRVLHWISFVVISFGLCLLLNGCAIGAKNRVMHQRVKPSEKLGKEMSRAGRKGARQYKRQLKRNKKAIGKGGGW